MKYFLSILCLCIYCTAVSQNLNDIQGFDEVSIANNGKLPEQFVHTNVFVKAEASTMNAYIGQPILVTYKFYNRLQAQSKVIKMPIFSGCSVQEMTTNDLVPTIETYNGKKYRVQTIRRVQLIPLHAGNIVLDTASVESAFTVYDKGVTQQQINQQQAFSHDEVFISNSKPVIVTVKDLPTNNQPNYFTGAIGNFVINAKLQKNNDTVNENNTLKISIVGEGNFAFISCPTVLWPSGCTGFEDNSNETVNKLVFPNTGIKEFTIPFVATQAGKYTIPPIKFSYFDADNHVYKNIETNSLALDVLSALPTNFDSSKLQKDITNKKYFWIVPAIALLAGIGWWIRFARKPSATKLIAQAEEKIEYEASITSTTQPYSTLNQQLEELVNNLHNDVSFFSKAKQIAHQLLQENSYYPNKELLEQIIGQCNAALYAGSNSINKQEMVESLRAVLKLHPSTSPPLQ
ncbi:MAG: BatD family protein [Chitinophagaceae bacterium]|jgi:hypothetical protein|nr:BatD family protein [Chitinophagaceae bacterium]